MKRVGLFGIVAAMAIVLTGCPITPPGYSPPWVVSFDSSPKPVRPGETVTLHIEAADDQGIASVGPVRFTTPSGSQLNAVGVCESLTTPHEDDPRNALITVTCPVPTYASNGTWYLKLHINDGSPQANYPGSDAQIPFEVAGGSDDRSAPQLVSFTTEPATIHQGTTFTLTMRIRDESLPVTVDRGYAFVKPFSPDSMFQCSDDAYAPVSPTEVDYTAICRPLYFHAPAPVETGLYRTAPLVKDALAQEANLEVSVNVEPGV